MPEARTAPGGASRRGSHRLAVITTCPRIWWLKYRQGINLKQEPTHRILGTLVHLCLAYHYANKLETPPTWAKTPLRDALIEVGRGYPEEIVQAQKIATAYATTYAGEAWMPVAVEQEFSATIGELRRMTQPKCPTLSGDEEIISCRSDLIVKVNGRLFLVDHKTLGKGYGQRLERWNDNNEYALPWQFLLGLRLVRHYYYGQQEVEGVIIQRIRRVLPYDFDRNVLNIPARPYEQAIETARLMVLKERELIARTDRGEIPEGHFWNCYGRYGPCEYRPLCLASAEEIPYVFDAEYRRDGPAAITAPETAV